MKERPILFSGPMVNAILDGRKTQTRRVATKMPAGAHRVCGYDEGLWEVMCGSIGDGFCLDWTEEIRCPYGEPGDRLWVRESFVVDDIRWAYGPGSLKDRPSDLAGPIYYRADGECCDQIPECACAEMGKPRWRPGRFMPRWACRITPTVVSVNLERVQDITEADAQAEGLFDHPRLAFVDLWDSINLNRGYGWESNPWVWVIEFEASK